MILGSEVSERTCGADAAESFEEPIMDDPTPYSPFIPCKALTNQQCPSGFPSIARIAPVLASGPPA